MNNYERWVVGLTSVIALVTSVYAAFAYKQWSEMHNQSGTLAKQLEESEAVQRAHLVIEDFDIGSTSSPNNSMTNRISFKLRNVGTTVAEEINVRFFEGIPAGTPDIAELSFNAFVRRVQPIQSGWNLAAGDTRLISGAGTITTSDYWNKQFEAAVAYRDIFGRVWKVADCISYDATVKHFSRCPYARHHD